ncbi:MAG: glucosamine-6-phosphate deaminase [Clostridiales bacterium]|jgi:glucosamine-6-phosphate deaminase|nr:glucosamine-6-phosphate deaminase [Clostridiales bacterium]
MKIVIENDYASLSLRAAEIIKAQVNGKPESVLGFATGSTPIGTYCELVKMYNANDVDFSKVVTFNLDEYYKIKKTDKQSYYHYMQTHLYRHVKFKETHIQDGEAADHAAECIAYEEEIASHGGIDLQILGIGVEGHIGFNESGDEFIAATHHVKLDESTIKENSRFFENENDVPKYALTMGIKTIFSAKKILLLANGANKAEILQKTVHGAITPKNPSSILQLHPDVTIITDREAGKLLV